jgi:hypothetical protein
MEKDGLECMPHAKPELRAPDYSKDKAQVKTRHTVVAVVRPYEPEGFAPCSYLYAWSCSKLEVCWCYISLSSNYVQLPTSARQLTSFASIAASMMIVLLSQLTRLLRARLVSEVDSTFLARE